MSGSFMASRATILCTTMQDHDGRQHVGEVRQPIRQPKGRLCTNGIYTPRHEGSVTSSFDKGFVAVEQHHSRAALLK